VAPSKLLVVTALATSLAGGTCTAAPSLRTPRSCRPLPAPRGGHAARVLDGKIHVLGGGNDVSTLAEHLTFDPKKTGGRSARRFSVRREASQRSPSAGASTRSADAAASTTTATPSSTTP